MERRNNIEAAIAALEDKYMKSTRSKSLEYTYGYMDALAVLREMRDENRPDVRRKCGVVST